MATVQAYQGTIHEGQIELDRPADLPEGNRVLVYVTEEGVAEPLLDPRLARRKANGWLATHVGRVVAQQPQLFQVGGQLVWRFKAFLTMQGHSPHGPAGIVDVDAYPGEVHTDESAATEMIANATALARSLSSTDR
jgi:hypothetical protein